MVFGAENMDPSLYIGASIHQKSNGTESQRTPFRKLLELLDTQV